MTESTNKRRVLICGGGTGGHFFSGVALAETLLMDYPDTQIIFVGTQNGIEGRTSLEDARMSIQFISAKGVKGKSVANKIFALFHLFCGFLESVRLLLKTKPEWVVGVGGYASVPTVFAAWILWLFRINKRNSNRINKAKVKVSVLEQNSSPGLANRIFSKLGVRSFSAFPRSGFQTVDLPLRKTLMEHARKARASSWPPKEILVVGGSQGAKGLNQRWREIVPELVKKYPGIRINHQTGKDDEASFKIFYSSISSQCSAFAFSHEMYRYYESADLIVCRSGAMTVFETMAFKRPCIFVPFPYATDDHQRVNAISVQNSDWVINERDFNWSKVENILGSPSSSVPQRKSAISQSWSEIFREVFK